MKVANERITKGFILAGLMNTSVLVFSRMFNNPAIAEFDPNVMSNFGLLMILMWGFAYISVAKHYHRVKWIVCVFAIEKFIYGCVWIDWMLNNDIYQVYERDFMAGVFYSIYGINDWIFFAFFTFVFYRLSRTPTIGQR